MKNGRKKRLTKKIIIIKYWMCVREEQTQEKYTFLSLYLININFLFLWLR